MIPASPRQPQRAANGITSQAPNCCTPCASIGDSNREGGPLDNPDHTPRTGYYLDLEKLRSSLREVRAISDYASGRADTLHDRVSGHHETIIELVGKSGQDGIVREMRVDMSSIQTAMAKQAKAMDLLTRRQERHGVKLAMIVAGASAGASVLGALIVSLILGGS